MERSYGLILPQDLTAEKAQFCIELAHLIGFHSWHYQFPILEGQESKAECSYFHFDTQQEDNEFSINLNAKTDTKKLWLSIHEVLLKQSGRQTTLPNGYLPTNQNPPEENLQYRIQLPQQCDEHVLQAACDVAARLGMDSAQAVYPICMPESEATDSKGYKKIVFTQAGEPEIHPSHEQELIHISGAGVALSQFVSKLLNFYPQMDASTTLEDSLNYLAQVFSYENTEGKALWNFEHQPQNLLLPAGAEVEPFQKQWPDLHFDHHTSSRVILEKNYPLTGENEEIEKQFLEVMIKKIKPGDRVKVFGSLWQGREEREQLLAQLKEKITQHGAVVEEAYLLCAYKEGLSWVEEICAPALKSIAKLAQIEIQYNPFNTSTADQVEAETEQPAKWLQDLYPIDVILADLLNLPCEKITFQPLEPDVATTYRVIAKDELNNIVYTEDYIAHAVKRPYLKRFSSVGDAFASTGYLCVQQNGNEILNTRILTDAERIWDVYQDEILPLLEQQVVEALAAQAGLVEEPFFSQLRLQIDIGGTERDEFESTEIISSGEALDENLHMVGKEFLRHLGNELTGQPFTAAGLILPLIQVRPGAPQFRIELWDHLAPTASIEPQQALVSVQSISYVNDSFQLNLKLEDPSNTPRLNQGFEDLIHSPLTKFHEHFQPFATVVIEQGTLKKVYSVRKTSETLHTLDLSELHIPDDCLIGYDFYLKIIEKLKQVKGLNVHWAGTSFQGRKVYTLKPVIPQQGYISKSKRRNLLPSVFLNGRHHANEISATNALFLFLKQLLQDPQYENITDHVNLIIVPMENVDSAAMHEELQKQHPKWQFHSCYTNSLGTDLMQHYYSKQTVCPEAQVFTSIVDVERPDVIIDCHGVPHHEMPRLFNKVQEQKGLWIPRTPLCGFFFHASDPEYRANTELAQAWEAAVANAVSKDSQFNQKSDILNQRFEKYAGQSLPGNRNGAYLQYWMPSPKNEQHPYPTVRYPKEISLMFTAEAADETATGEDLAACVALHLKHLFAGLNLVLHANCVFENTVVEDHDSVLLKQYRLKPLIASNTNPTKEEEAKI